MAQPPFEAQPDKLEEYRDRVLQRLITVREKAVELNKPEFLKDFPTWDGIAQNSRIPHELGQVEIGLDYLEILMGI